MKRSKYLCVVVLVFFFVFLGLPAILFSETESAYNKYEPTFKDPAALTQEAAKKRDRNQIFLRILEQPLRPIGYAVGEMAEWTERHQIDRKTAWFIDKMLEYGIHPSFDAPETSDGLRLGASLELDKLLKIKSPNLKLNVFGGWTYNTDSSESQSFDIGGKYRVGMPFSNAVYQEGVFNYARRVSESFFGLGNLTSLGDWSTYKAEEVKIEEKLGCELISSVSADTSFIFQHVNIGNGRRKNVGKIKDYFANDNIPGINGATLMGIRGGLSHDSRDNPDDPKHGGKEQVDLGYFFDIEGNNFHYLKIIAAVTHFFSLWSDRRVLALRFKVEKNESLRGGKHVPFFNMARLGGNEPAESSDLLRSYRFNRFFDEGVILANAEYRYNIWEYGNFGADAFGLFDVGEVFQKVSNFVFDRLKLSYGGGLNLKFRRRTLLSLTAASGDEGWRFSIHSSKSF